MVTLSKAFQIRWVFSHWFYDGDQAPPLCPVCLANILPMDSHCSSHICILSTPFLNIQLNQNHYWVPQLLTFKMGKVGTYDLGLL